MEANQISVSSCFSFSQGIRGWEMLLFRPWISCSQCRCALGNVFYLIYYIDFSSFFKTKIYIYRYILFSLSSISPLSSTYPSYPTSNGSPSPLFMIFFPFFISSPPNSHVIDSPISPILLHLFFPNTTPHTPLIANSHTLEWQLLISPFLSSFFFFFRSLSLLPHDRDPA